MQRLATYGTLRPGESNHRQVSGLRGRWFRGSVRGRLLDAGWGAGWGFPGLVLDATGETVPVDVLESPDLDAHWDRLDAFEGGEYRRVCVTVTTDSGMIDACVYVVAPEIAASHHRVDRDHESRSARRSPLATKADSERNRDMADTPRTPVVDTHVHAGTTKYEPVESLLDQMTRHGVDHAVLVQHMGMFDNDYLIACAAAHQGRFAIACLVDVHAPGADARLGTLIERHPAVQGVRLYLADLFGGLPEARAVWNRADALGLNITVAGTLAQLASDDMQAEARKYTKARLHLEHLCHPNPTEAPPFPTYRRALSLAELDHCALKVSGFYAFTQSPWSPYLDTLRFVDLALEAFGPERMMWGSDFPPVSGREGYGNAIAFARHHVGIGDPALRAQLMGGTATRFWDFHPTTEE